MLFPQPETPFLPPLPNSLLSTLRTLAFGKCHFLRDTFSPPPQDPLDPFTNSCFMAFPLGNYPIIVPYLLILYMSSPLSLPHGH